MGGDAVRACGSVLYRIQVRVNPCGARGGAGLEREKERERERELGFCLMERLLALSL